MHGVKSCPRGRSINCLVSSLVVHRCISTRTGTCVDLIKMLFERFLSRQLQIAVPRAPSSIAKSPSTKPKSNVLSMPSTRSPLMQATLDQLEAARQFRHEHLDSLKDGIAIDTDAEQRTLLLREWRHCYEKLVRLENSLDKKHDKGMRIRRFHEMSTKEWIGINGPKHVHIPFSSPFISGDCWPRSIV